MYAKVNGQQVVQYPYSLNLLKIEHPNTSFPSDMTEEDLASFGVVRVVVTGKPVHDAVTQGVREITPELTVKGTWEQRWEVYSLPHEATEAKLAELAKAVRSTRNQKLKDSDWTQVADAPVDKTVWATYRQELRDVTAQPGFPTSVTWPTEP